jgi:hypothetical protein
MLRRRQLRHHTIPATRGIVVLGTSNPDYSPGPSLMDEGLSRSSGKPSIFSKSRGGPPRLLIENRV